MSGARLLLRVLAAALGLGAAVAASARPVAQPTSSDSAVARFFDDYMTRTIDRLDLPGGAIVVVRDGRPILAKGYGYADVASKRAVDVETSLFRAASISKTLTWLLAMQLVEEGRLDLDRDIQAYLDFRISGASGRPITMRHLMTHSAGFADRIRGVLYPAATGAPLGRTLRDNIPERVYAPGSTVAYSNYGGALAGYIVERLRGRPFERVVAERLFAPVGMRRSTFAQPVPATLRPLLVSNYAHGSGSPVPFRSTPLPPMGSLTASAGDMGRFLAMLTAGGRGPNGRVVAPGTLKRMFELQKPLGPGLDSGMGFGFLVGTHRGIRYAGHAGNMTHVATDLEILPDLGLGYYYVFNGQGPGDGAARAVRLDLLNAAIERLAAPRSADVRASGPSSAADLAGSWVSTRRQRSGPMLMSALMDTAEVYPEPDGSLWILLSGKASRWLPAGRDRFLEAETGSALAVTRGPDGSVERIAGAFLYPVAEYERAPAFVPWVESVTKFSLGTFALALLAAPVAWALRRRRRRRAGAEAPGLAPSRAARIAGRWSRIAYWTIAATLGAWGIFSILVMRDPGVLFTAPLPVRASLGLLAWLTVPAAAMLLVAALLGLSDPSRSRASRLWALPLAASAVGLAWLLWVFDVANFSADW